MGALTPAPPPNTAAQTPASPSPEPSIEPQNEADVPPVPSPRRYWTQTPLGCGIGAMVSLLLIVLAFPLLDWQRRGQQRALSLSNLRRLSLALRMYAQDYDGCLMPPVRPMPDGRWQTWPDLTRPYASPLSVFSNPANPVASYETPLTHPTLGYPVQTSYALNRRFFGVFAPGPFPVDNLELPARTALLVESGPLWQSATRPTHPLSRYSVLDYGDTTERVGGLILYPSTHDGRMALAAADGHAVVVRVEYYDANVGWHDPQYGRIGGDVYNWNGGHPNGQTDTPPRE